MTIQYGQNVLMLWTEITIQTLRMIYAYVFAWMDRLVIVSLLSFDVFNV